MLKTTHWFKATLFVEGACGRIVSVQVAKQAFEFGHFVVPDVVPDFEHGTVRPEFSFRSAMASESPADPSLPSHADIHYVVVMLECSPVRGDELIKHVDATQARRQPPNVVDG